MNRLARALVTGPVGTVYRSPRACVVTSSSAQDKGNTMSEESKNNASGVVSEIQRVEKQERNKQLSKGEERKESKKKNFLLRQHDVEKTFLSGEPMILLLYKEATLFANAQGEEFPSAIVSHLQEFEDVVVDEMPPELP